MRVSSQPLLVPGDLYGDLDGELVQLVSVDRDLCCWTPLSHPLGPREITHRDNFVLRFQPLSANLIQAA